MGIFLRFLIIIAVFFPAACGSLTIFRDRVYSPLVLNGKVRFQLYSPSAANVYLAGEFNDWQFRPDQEKALLLEEIEDNLFSIDIVLSPGRYQYKFVVNQKTWILDPANSVTFRDSAGNVNSLVIVR